jgi:hypothetical protein
MPRQQNPQKKKGGGGGSAGIRGSMNPPNRVVVGEVEKHRWAVAMGRFKLAPLLIGISFDDHLGHLLVLLS